MEVNIYIGFCDLEGEVHSIWDLWVSGFQECKSNEFFQNRAGGQQFSGGSKKTFFSDRRLPPPDSDSPKSSWGGGVFKRPPLIVGFTIRPCCGNSPCSTTVCSIPPRRRSGKNAIFPKESIIPEAADALDQQAAPRSPRPPRRRRRERPRIVAAVPRGSSARRRRRRPARGRWPRIAPPIAGGQPGIVPPGRAAPRWCRRVPPSSFVHEVMSINDLVAFATGVRFAIDTIQVVRSTTRGDAGRDRARRAMARRVRGFRHTEGSNWPVYWTEVYINREFAAVGRLLQRHRGPIFHLIEDLFGQSIVEVHQEIAAALISPALAGRPRKPRRASSRAGPASRSWTRTTASGRGGLRCRGPFPRDTPYMKTSLPRRVPHLRRASRRHRRRLRHASSCNIQTKTPSATAPGKFDYRVSCIIDESGDEVNTVVTAASDDEAFELAKLKGC